MSISAALSGGPADGTTVSAELVDGLPPQQVLVLADFTAAVLRGPLTPPSHAAAGSAYFLDPYQDPAATTQAYHYTGDAPQWPF